MTETSRYRLPLLQAGQAQKEITHNDAVARVDALLHLVVESRRIGVSPAGVVGCAWLVAAPGAGEWIGQDGNLAVFDDAGWSFIVPRDGCIAFVRDESLFIHYGGGWRDSWPVSAVAIGDQLFLSAETVVVSAPAGGSVVDVEARATIAQLLTALRRQGLVAAT